MPQYTLPRTGDMPYQYSSEDYRLLVDCDSKTAKSQRSHRVRLFSSNNLALPFLIAITYESKFEAQFDEVIVLPLEQGIDAAYKTLQRYDPLKRAQGLPTRTDKEATQNNGRNRQINADLKARWELLLSTVAEKLGLVEHRAVGRPTISKEGEGSEVISTRFPTSQLAKIDQLRGELTRSEFVRKATDAYILIKTS